MFKDPMQILLVLNTDLLSSICGDKKLPFKDYKELLNDLDIITHVKMHYKYL